MGFNSFTFILAFLPILLIGWHLLNRAELFRIADVFLIGLSLYFYYSFGVSFLVILLVSIAVNYVISAVMEKSEASRKPLKAVGVLFNLALLFYFKYLGFFVDNINALFNAGISAKEILMPIGISFFTFGG